MRIVGFSISKISGERKEIIKGKFDVKSNVDIKNIEKQAIEISDKGGLKIDFVFSVNYNPKFANIEIAGSVLTLDDNDESKQILKDWKKKKVNVSAKIPIFNFIMDKCNLKAMQVEDELNLPLHLPLPKVSAQPVSENPANYAG